MNSPNSTAARSKCCASLWNRANVTISRAVGSMNFPADLMLVAALNPCPCGYRGDPRRQCNCNPLQIEKYIGKISGPLLDRIDIHLEVTPVPFREISDAQTGTTSAQMRAQVVAARAIQQQRFAGERNSLNGPDDSPADTQVL